MQNLLHNLTRIVGNANVLSAPDELLVYECDGLTQHKYRPQAVVFPANTDEVAAIMRELASAKVPYTPRGAGTGLSGGALALNDGVVIELARMRKILRIDALNRFAVVQPGVINLQVSKAAAPFDLYYVPDPSSQPTCTIGGNIAESAGGIHCLKYGTTTDHVLGCRVVLSSGDIVDLGSSGLDVPGYDLVGTFVGSEGTFGIVTEATLKLVPLPPAVRTLLAEFMDVNDASHAVSAIIAEGVIPAALEMMDHEIIRAVEASVFAAGLPSDVGAALLIELDGIEAGLDDEADRVTNICRQHGARACRRARDETERKKLWAARKGAFGAIGRISPDSMIQDAVVPRSRLPEVLAAAYQIAARHHLKLANVFHAGDGNLHPLICFDSRFSEQVTHVKEAGRELMQVCVAAGGTITGEHGVGLDKRELLPLVFSDTDMEVMLGVRAAFDPTGLLNPGKIIPMLRGCGEGRTFAKKHGADSTSLELRPTRLHAPSIPPKTASTQGSFNPNYAAGKLVEIVGDDYVEFSDSVFVYPDSTAAISEILKLATCEHWTVSPAGTMTWTNAVRPSNVIVSTARLDRILDHEPADLITIAEAGVRLQDLNAALGKRGQWVPLDPPDNGRVTIGGVVATGLGGAQQLAYGRPRGSVIGMKVVLADGRLVKTGGRVVKNVAGYDLSKLFTGSFGSLGVITEVNFKLRPRPQREATIVSFGSVENLIEAAGVLIDARLFPVATELVSATVAIRLGFDFTPTLMVRFAGTHKAVDFQLETTLQSLNKTSLESRLLNDDLAVWQNLAALPISANLSVRASVLRSRLASVFSGSPRWPDLALWQAGIADGRIRLMNGIKGDLTNMVSGIKNFCDMIQTNNGTITIEQMPEEFTEDLNVIPRDNGSAAIASRIKSQLDPLSLFPPSPPPNYIKRNPQ